MRLRAFLRRLLRSVLGWPDGTRDLDEEVRAHVAMEAEDLVRTRGLPPDEARRQAALAFGPTEAFKEKTRDVRRLPFLDAWLRDARHGLRAIGRRPGFAVVVVLVLAVGMAATATVFGLLHAVVLRPLPYPESDRLVVLEHTVPEEGLEHAGLPPRLSFDYRDRATTLESIGLYQRAVTNLETRVGGTERIHLTRAGVDVFRALGVRPILGRLFTEQDAEPGFMDATWPIPVLLSYELWMDRFGGDPDIIGRPIVLNKRERTIVGVMPRGFRFPDSETRVWMLFEYARPAAAVRASTFRGSQPAGDGPTMAGNVARLAPGATMEAAEAELAAILRGGSGRDAGPDELAPAGVTPHLRSLEDVIVGDAAGVLWTLFGGMVCLLVIAAANVASLFRVRAETRTHEVAVRRALGANRRQVVRLFFVEAWILTTVAAGLALLLARALLAAVVAYAPMHLPRAADVGLGEATMVLAAAVATVLAGGYALLSARTSVSLTTHLTRREGTGAMDSARSRRRDPLLVLQVALALTLMVASTLMVRTYTNLSRRDLGFQPHDVLTIEIGLPSSQYREHVRIYRGLVERVRAVPGVDDASMASFAPLTGVPDAFPVEPGTEPIPFKFYVPGYFRAIGTPIVDGSGPAGPELASQTDGVFVSAALARRLYPDRQAVGRTVTRLRQDGSVEDVPLPGSNGSRARVPRPPFRIAGIAGDVREASLRSDPTEIVYVPVADPPVELSIVPTDMTLIIRSSLAPTALVAGVRQAIQDVNPDLSLGDVRTLDAIVLAARGTEAFVGMLLVLAAGASLLLGVVGIYGTVAYRVRCRTHEIGIRAALGASRPALVWMIAAGTSRLVLVGTMLGLIVAALATRALQSLLFGVASGDPITYVTVTLAVAAAAIAAALLAAGRAAGVAPIEALRGE